MFDILKQNPELEKTIQQVGEIASYLWKKGWAESNAGNISVNVHDLITGTEFGDLTEYPVFNLSAVYSELAGKYFFVTCTGKRMRDLARAPMNNAIIIRIAEDGASYSMISQCKSATCELRPTSELSTHLGIHQLIARRGSKEKVIIHTHVNELIALTHNPNFKSAEILNRMLWGMHTETMVYVPKGIGFVPYILPGSQAIAFETINKLQYHDIVLWEKHGVFAIGESVSDTFDTIDIIAKAAKIYFMCKNAGFEPEGLSTEQLDELKELDKKSSAG